MLYDRKKKFSIDAEDSIRGCADAGYKYLDLVLDAYLKPNMPLAADGWQKWAEDLAEYTYSLGLEFSQSHGYFYPKTNLDSNGIRQDPLYDENVRRSIISSQICGVKWMVLHPTLWPDADGNADVKRSLEYNREFFLKWGEFASLHKVGIAVENMYNYLDGMKYYCVMPEEIIELVDAVNDPMVRICIDTGHAHLSRLDVPDYIKAVGSRLKATHIDDNRQTADDHLAPFQGTIPWNEVMQAFKDINYQNDFSFEIQHFSSCFPAKIQSGLVGFSHSLGKYLLSL